MPQGSDQQDFLRFERAGIEQSIPARFAEQAARYPDRLAVSSGHQDLTYRQLDRLTNRLARQILALRGDAAEPVAMLLDQGISAVVAVLGILKAGKMYVALEPALPIAELARIVADCRPGLVVTDRTHNATAVELIIDTDRCVAIDALDNHMDEGPLDLPLGPDRLAYIFYTSGSTGPAKGVYDSHRNVLHNIMRYTNSLQIGRDDRLSLIQSPAFSGTVSSLFAALLNGAAVFPFDLKNQGVARLADWVADQRLTIFHAVPTIFEHLAAAARPFPDLRLIRLEGDEAHRRHVTAFQAKFEPYCVLVNGLGATETGLVRQFFVTQQTAVTSARVPIGQPVEDMDLLLLDDDGRSVPDGTVGDIAIRSPYLALGYWQRPDLTAQAFRGDPAAPGLRLYRTGDLGRMLPGGCLLHLGRKDFDVKIRGQRIEIAEIEDSLRAVPGIDQALVAVREDRPGHQQLVAYVVPATGDPPTVTSLREALGRTLPELMVPARYVFCDTLPMDANGKLQRRDLPVPDSARPSLDTPFAPPLNHRQRQLAACFESVLGVGPVGVNDGFFDLGGDSLLATELILAVEEQLQVVCPVDFLATASTVAELEELLGTDRAESCATTLQPRGTAPPLFCLHDYSGHALIYRHLAGALAPDQPVVALQRHADTAHLPLSVADLACTYVREIIRIQPAGPYHLCGNCFGGIVAFEVAQQLRDAGRPVALLALIDTAFPVGPLGRLTQKLAPQRRLRRLGAMGWRDRLGYVATRALGALRWIGVAARRRIQSLATRHSGRPGPRRGLALVDANHLAAARYVPRPYDSAAVLFCLGRPHNQLAWRRVVKGGLQVVQLPFAGSEDDDSRPHPIQHPHVAGLATELRQRLDR